MNQTPISLSFSRPRKASNRRATAPNVRLSNFSAANFQAMSHLNENVEEMEWRKDETQNRVYNLFLIFVKY